MLAESGVSGQVAFSGKGNRGNKPEGNGRAFKIFRVQGAGVCVTVHHKPHGMPFLSKGVRGIKTVR